VAPDVAGDLGPANERDDMSFVKDIRSVPAVMAACVFAGCTYSQTLKDAGMTHAGTDVPYWRGEREMTPGSFLCRQPAATNVAIVCDRWPDGSDLRQFGLDAARLSGAITDQERCIAVWRWVRRWTMYTDGNPPTEPFQRRKGGYVDDPIKLLNVNGAHWCDGLSRIVEAIWRAMGHRAEKLYRGGHTMVDCHWADADGVARWHAFDVSEGGFRYSHDRSHLLGPDGMSADSYPMLITWIHCQHLRMPTHRVDLALRVGEKLERIWGNWGRPYQDNVRRDHQTVPEWERGPYPVDYGNGRWTYMPDLAGPDWRRGLAVRPVNLSDARLMPATAGKQATAVWRFRTPYIIADAQVRLRFHRRGAADAIRLHLSVDDGRTWKQVWEAPPKAVGRRQRTVSVCERFKVAGRARPPKGFHSPFGRYAYRLKLELVAAERPEDCVVEALTFTTDVQQNYFALPQLQPGRNRITVRGDLAEGAALRVTYFWDDAAGEGRRNVTVVDRTPHTYEILAVGRKWDDVVCRSITVEAVSAKGEGSRTSVMEPAATLHEPPPMRPADATRGRWQRPDRAALRPVETLVKALRSADTRVQRKALVELIEHRDPKAFDALKRAAYELGAGGVKRAAITALYVTDPERAKPILLDLMSDETKSAWKHDPGNPAVRGGHWAMGCALIGQIAKVEGWGEEAVPGLVRALKHPHSYTGAQWALLRLLGQIGDRRAGPAVRPFLRNRNQDTVALAALAAGRCCDWSVVPRLRELLHGRAVIARINAARSLGWLGDGESAPVLRKMLRDPGDENIRAASAEALGRLRDEASLAELRAALEAEPFPWVRERIAAAIRELEGK
jgi:HEAT repeat protein